MKITLTGKSSENVEPLLKNFGLPADRQGFEIVEENPEIVISYGGDGTLLASERKYPSLAKLPIRNSAVCKKCSEHEEEALLKKLLKGALKLKEYGKLETEIEGKKLLALNDFVIRNKDAIHSIRFRMPPDEKLIIGDGIVISTPFGSSGYFKSITDQTFDSGFALAFNNTTDKMDPRYFKDNEQVTFKLVRGQAALTSDNSPDIYIIPEGMEIKFSLSDQKAKIYELESLRCPNCKVFRG